MVGLQDPSDEAALNLTKASMKSAEVDYEQS